MFVRDVITTISDSIYQLIVYWLLFRMKSVLIYFEATNDEENRSLTFEKVSRFNNIWTCSTVWLVLLMFVQFFLRPSIFLTMSQLWDWDTQKDNAELDWFGIFLITWAVANIFLKSFLLPYLGRMGFTYAKCMF